MTFYMKKKPEEQIQSQITRYHDNIFKTYIYFFNLDGLVKNL